MKLSIVIPCLNQIELAQTCYKEIVKNTDNSQMETEFIIIDNGCDTPIQKNDFYGAKIVRNEVNNGVYPTFKQGMEVSQGDAVAFLHSDVVIWEKGWNVRVAETFIQNPKTGLIGFIGSSQIDEAGGRGLGTASNFQGKPIVSRNRAWVGSKWDRHGAHLQKRMKGAVVDGCVMILSRTAWNAIGYRDKFPPHHFYDRLISTQMLDALFDIIILGIAFDHVSGQTVNVEKKYQLMAHDWLLKSGHIGNTEFDERHNYDTDVYNIAESMWLKEYKLEKHLIPITI